MSGEPRGDMTLELLYVAERARIYARCLAMLGDPTDAEDAVQETFARVAVRLASLQGDPAGYLLAVARNVCLDELRRRRRSVPVESPEERDAAPRGADDTAVDRQLLGAAWEALPESDRALLAYTFCGLSLAEIGRRVGLGVDAVAQRVSRARRRVRHLVLGPAALLWPPIAGSASRMARLAATWPLRGGLPLLRVRTPDPGSAPVLAALLAGLLALLPSAGANQPAPSRQNAPPVAMAPPHAPLPGLLAGNARALAHDAHSLLQHAPAAAQALPTAAPPPPALPGLHVTGLTPSPQYGSGDHTLFATGTCDATPGCAPLQRSDDAGRTWRPLGGAGMLPGSRLLLPPDFPSDTVLLAIAPLSRLMRSSDGGATFTAATPELRGDAAVDPASPPGDPHVYVIALTGQALLVYGDAARSLSLDPSLPPDVDQVTTVFTGRGDAHVYASVNELVQGGALYQCGGGAPCRRVGPATLGAPSAISPTFGADRTYFSFTAGGIVIDRVDGGDRRTVATGWASTVAILPAADYATSGRLDVVVRGTAHAGGLIAMLRYITGMATPAPIASGWTTDVDFDTAQRLPDGIVLAGRTGTGIACSHDGGSSFAASC